MTFCCPNLRRRRSCSRRAEAKENGQRQANGFRKRQQRGGARRTTPWFVRSSIWDTSGHFTTAFPRFSPFKEGAQHESPRSATGNCFGISASHWILDPRLVEKYLTGIQEGLNCRCFSASAGCGRFAVGHQSLGHARGGRAIGKGIADRSVLGVSSFRLQSQICRGALRSRYVFPNASQEPTSCGRIGCVRGSNPLKSRVVRGARGGL